MASSNLVQKGLRSRRDLIGKRVFRALSEQALRPEGLIQFRFKILNLGGEGLHIHAFRWIWLVVSQFPIDFIQVLQTGLGRTSTALMDMLQVARRLVGMSRLMLGRGLRLEIRILGSIQGILEF